MRAFRISLVLFALTIALIVIGTWYGRDVCDKLEQMTLSMPDEPSDEAITGAVALQKYWQGQLVWLRPMVNRTVVRTMSDLVGDLAIYAAPTLDAAPEYRSTKQKLLGAIDEMRRAERATFGMWS